MITINASAIWLVLLAVGVPSGVVGFLIHRLEKNLEKAEKIREDKEEKRVELQKALINLSVDSLELAKVTAEAVQRIPDANCNGEMTQALNRASDTLNTFRTTSLEQTAKLMAKTA